MSNYTPSPSDLGTRPTGDTIKLGVGQDVNGPAILPSDISLFKFSSNASLLTMADLRFLDSRASLGSLYFILKPALKPSDKMFASFTLS